MIDPSEAHAGELRAVLAVWVAVARRTFAGRGRRVVANRAATSDVSSAAQLKLKRAWTASNGFEICAKGRVPRKVEEAYAAAHAW